MPYIQPQDRTRYDGAIEQLLGALPREKFAGALNYVVSRLCAGLLDAPSYARINELVGVLECAKLELYRRVAAPYEDVKAREHGDVYRAGP